MPTSPPNWWSQEKREVFEEKNLGVSTVDTSLQSENIPEEETVGKVGEKVLDENLSSVTNVTTSLNQKMA